MPKEEGTHDFLYDAIFVPDGEIPPDKSIIGKPELFTLIWDSRYFLKIDDDNIMLVKI